MTFDECIEELKSESDEAKEIIERAEEESKAYDHLSEVFLELCNEYGVEVKDGTGRILIDGKEIDIAQEIKEAFPRPTSR